MLFGTCTYKIHSLATVIHYSFGVIIGKTGTEITYKIVSR